MTGREWEFFLSRAGAKGGGERAGTGTRGKRTAGVGGIHHRPHPPWEDRAKSAAVAVRDGETCGELGALGELDATDLLDARERCGASGGSGA